MGVKSHTKQISCRAIFFLFSCFVAVVTVLLLSGGCLFVSAGSFLSVFQIKSLSILTRKRHFIKFLTLKLIPSQGIQNANPFVFTQGVKLSNMF